MSMSFLFALPISGDAFLLETPTKTILVDGGRSGPRLAEALKEVRPALRHIDIVVCTHADSDHAAGIAKLLQCWQSKKDNWKGSVGEFWLPGRWRPIVAEALGDPKALVDAIVDTIDSINQRHEDLRHADDKCILEEALLPGEDADREGEGDPIPPDSPPRSEEHNRFPKTEKVRRKRAARVFPPRKRLRKRPELADDAWCEQSDVSEAPAWSDPLFQAVDDLLTEREQFKRHFKLGRRRIEYRAGSEALAARGRPSWPIHIRRPAANYWNSLIDTAELIAEIASSAIRARVPIRWFDQQRFEESGMRGGGLRDILLPMNAYELRSLPLPVSGDENMVLRLVISRANQESLVFYAPPALTNSHGVLFCADTALTWGWGDRWELPAYAAMKHSKAVATAPHHGSEHNARAYGLGQMHYNVCFWIRSHAGGAIGPTFKALYQRTCTECPGNVPLRAICVSLSAPCWTRLTARCCC